MPHICIALNNFLECFISLSLFKIYLLLAVMRLCGCAGFSLVVGSGAALSLGESLAVASLAVEHGL